MATEVIIADPEVEIDTTAPTGVSEDTENEEEVELSLEEQIADIEAQMLVIAQENLKAKGAINKFSNFAHQYIKLADTLDDLEDKKIGERQNEVVFKLKEMFGPVLSQADFTHAPGTHLRVGLTFPCEKFPEGNVALNHVTPK